MLEMDDLLESNRFMGCRWLVVDWIPENVNSSSRGWEGDVGAQGASWMFECGDWAGVSRFLKMGGVWAASCFSSLLSSFLAQSSRASLSSCRCLPPYTKLIKIPACVT